MSKTASYYCRQIDNNAHQAKEDRNHPLLPLSGVGPTAAARLINARAETVHTKPSFGVAFRSRRCLVPANGWFEWQRLGGGKQPYYLALADGSPLSFAALWERWGGDGESVESFTIITTTAAPQLADIHHRQPAIVSSERFDDWLDPTSPIPRLLELLRNPVSARTRGAPSARG